MSDEPLRIDRAEDGVVTLTLNRPDVRNALNQELLTALHDAAQSLAGDADARIVVLTGSGDLFCAGADVSYMRAVGKADPQGAGLTEVFRSFYELPKPLICRCNGAALGGGSGLVAVCDIVIASTTAFYAFPEVRLGIVPAVISPYVVRKVGTSFARAMFLTGERFDAHRAREVGLVHEVVEPDQLDEAVARTVARCRKGGPRALAIAKRLPGRALGPLDQVDLEMADTIAELRAGEEGQEGLSAFLEGRAPAWQR